MFETFTYAVARLRDKIEHMKWIRESRAKFTAGIPLERIQLVQRTLRGSFDINIVWVLLHGMFKTFDDVGFDKRSPELLTYEAIQEAATFKHDLFVVPKSLESLG